MARLDQLLEAKASLLKARTILCCLAETSDEHEDRDGFNAMDLLEATGLLFQAQSTLVTTIARWKSHESD